jgi:hypothetical protein
VGKGIVDGGVMGDTMIIVRAVECDTENLK